MAKHATFVDMHRVFLYLRGNIFGLDSGNFFGYKSACIDYLRALKQKDFKNWPKVADSFRVGELWNGIGQASTF